MIGTAVDKSDCDSAGPLTTTAAPPYTVDGMYYMYEVAEVDQYASKDSVMACKIGVATAATLMVGLIQVGKAY